MKKYRYIIFAAACAFVVAACAKEEFEAGNRPQRELRTLTCSFEAAEQTDETKTAITKQGKTVWTAGDQLWVSDGTNSDTLTVAPEFDGQKFCEFKTKLTGKVYVVYPLKAAKAIDAEKFILDVPRIQDGTFGSANISVAVAEDRYVKMRNVTSVVKFRIPADAKPVKVVSVNAADNVVAGECTVDMSSGSPVVTADKTSGDVLVKVDGLAGNFYASVVPGTYNAGFTMSAISIDLKNAFEAKTTSAANELKPNDYVDLGMIGGNLKPLQGDGTEGNPWQISSLPEMLAFTYYVNEGNTMEGQYIKVVNDIKGVTVPVGIYDDADKSGKEFKGSFDGGDKTITLAMNQKAGKTALALFANVTDGASIKNVNVAGNVASNYHYAAGLVARLFTQSPITIANCKSTATVSGKGYAGGIVAYADNPKNKNVVTIDKCVNEGAVSGLGWYVGGVAGGSNDATLTNCSNSGVINGAQCVAGISGNAYSVNITDCTNSGNVTATHSAGAFLNNKGGGATYRGGAAGMAGYAQNVNLKRCTNSGAIAGVNKTGGIAGTLYWGSAVSCSNSGSVSVTEDAAGGILGWNVTHGRLYDCTNTGTITTKRYQAGGIVGQAQSFHAKNSAKILYLKCSNEGKITVTDGNSAGGIVGYTWVMNNLAKITIDGCVNKTSAEVSAPKYAGGILGSEGRYSNWSRMEIQNCENHGYILGTGTGAATAVYVGGIFGGPIVYTKNQGVMIFNCYNTGNVEYADAAATKPFAGGIAGHINHGFSGTLNNLYNSGKVRPKEGEPAATAGLGSIVGHSSSGGTINFIYSLDGICPNLIGAGSRPASAAVSSVADAAGSLTTPVTVNEVGYAEVSEALNAWSKMTSGNVYYGWAKGPVFVYPSYTDPIDSGNFDLGNGGQI